MTFDAYDRSLDMQRALAPLVKLLATHDADLTKQLRRAATSVTLDISEANRRAGKDRSHLFRVALGSAAEVTACIDTAVAHEYLDLELAVEVLSLADRIRAMTFRLSRRA